MTRIFGQRITCFGGGGGGGGRREVFTILIRGEITIE